MTNPKRKGQRWLLVAIGLLQGIALYSLIQFESMPPFIYGGLFCSIILLGLLLQLSLPSKKSSALALTAIILSLVLGLTFGHLYSNAAFFEAFPLYLLLLLTMYMSIAYHVSYFDNDQCNIEYDSLFNQSWNIAFYLIVAGFFTAFCGAILNLWAALFKYIEINYFDELFYSRPFYMIITPLLFGAGLAIAREFSGVILALRRVFFAICYVLLPLVAFIGLFFILTLIFSNVPLKSATGVILTLPVLGIILVNTVVKQAQRQSHYMSGIRWMIMAFIILLPAYPIVSLYKLMQGISQVGYSPLTLQQVALASLIACYCLAYAITALFRSKNWLSSIPRINILLSFVVIITTILLSTPLLDPYKLSLQNQVKRLLAGQEIADSAYLNGAKLRNADLTGRDLRFVHLEDADLTGANLSRANLSFAHLNGALLHNTLLTNANLSGANFNHANLSDADLTGAILSSAIFKQTLGLTQWQLDRACLRNIELNGRSIKQRPPLSLPVGLYYKECLPP